jgi:enediyne polyketide synthase
VIDDAIAIVGLACHYPDARTPKELWHNVLAGRRAFRPIPSTRLSLDDYAPRSEHDADSTYVKHAALIEDFELDRTRFRISASTLRSTDLAHWLALDVADRALRDAGSEDGTWLSRDTTGVIVGNSLTGESSRTAALRLRWPYVRRSMLAALDGVESEQQRHILETAESVFKAPLAAPDDDSLAGGLSNTIAGRICNMFDLRGGGFAIDGACSSSLLAVSQACTALVMHDLDVALAGAVDISLDPFELVGFARLGALARDEMRVYDARPTGFIPGEGAAFVVLMRYRDALASGRRVYAVLRGWGVASDGSGGMTRPRVEGHAAALARCYRRAGFGIDTVPLFEGHGTGTAVGDATELAAIAGTLRAAGATRRASIGTIKAQIGHTKAAAGMAGLLKTVFAVMDRIIPPAIGVCDPHDELRRADAVLTTPLVPEDWPADRPPRAGVSAIGFGGINVHVCVEAVEHSPRTPSALRKRLAASAQDVELLVLDANSNAELAAKAGALARRVEGASLAELGDIAAALARRAGAGTYRAAIVAGDVKQAALGMAEIQRRAERGEELADVASAQYVFRTKRIVRVGFLFSGQAAPVPADGGALCRRFVDAAEVWQRLPPRFGTDLVDTRNAQPAITAASLAAARVLEALGLQASFALGHSLGELAALAWAGCWSTADVIALAAARGVAMAEASSRRGAMLGIAAGAEVVRDLVRSSDAVIAAFNSTMQTVVSGPVDAIDEIERRAAARALTTTRLRTSHAFHSPLMSGSATRLQSSLARLAPARAQRCVISTVTASPYVDSTAIGEVLAAQLTAPVRFVEAIASIDPVDLFVEVGPGNILASLATLARDTPAIAVDSCGRSLHGLLSALGAAWSIGAPVQIGELFVDRWYKTVDLDQPPRLLSSPCEQLPRSARPIAPLQIEPDPQKGRSNDSDAADVRPPAENMLDVVRDHVASLLDLSIAAISDDARLLEDLHLSSIAIAQLVTKVARRLGLPAPNPLVGWARATVRQVADAFADSQRDQRPVPRHPLGAAAWVRTFRIVDEPCAPPGAAVQTIGPWRCYGARAEDCAAIAAAIDGVGAGGAVAVIGGASPEDMRALLEAVRDGGPLLVLDPRRICGGFARTVHLETSRPVCRISYDRLDASTQAALRAEAAALTAGFRDVHIEGSRLVRPVLEAIRLPAADSQAITSNDVVLVSGGAKGIAAECVLALGEQTGCRIITIGRTAPEDDPVLAASLERFAQRNVAVTHVAADITDAARVHDAVKRAVDTTGPVTAIVHAAARNEPRAVHDLDIDEIQRTVAPKVVGLSNLLDAVDQRRLRHVIAFGSVIARSGLPGEAHYALANELLRSSLDALREELPGCACTLLEYSAWSDVGMAARIGRLEALCQRGLVPIPIEHGVATFLRSIGASGTLVISGRLGDAGLIDYRAAELPMLRFLERPIVHVCGVELVAELELSPEVDLYLDDHVLDGARVFPAVLQIEAAFQAIAALDASSADRVVENIEFTRAIVVDDGGVTLRVAACLQENGSADVIITASDDAHSSIRMRARVRRGSFPRSVQRPATAIAEPIQPPYRDLLPQRGRFARIRAYSEVRTYRCAFEVRADATAPWFARHVPNELCVAEPGPRDAALHGIQAAIPHERLVPIGAHRIFVARSWPTSPMFVEGEEVARDNGEYIWDLVIRDERGVELERWERARFRPLGTRTTIPRSAVEQWLERHLREHVPDVWLVRDANHRHRPDGKPECSADVEISASDTADIRFVVGSRDRVACDFELVRELPSDEWKSLLGDSAPLTRSLPGSFDRAATMVWSARECCAKLGAPNGQLCIEHADITAGVARLRSGAISIVIFGIAVADRGDLVVSIATAPRIDVVLGVSR